MLGALHCTYIVPNPLYFCTAHRTLHTDPLPSTHWPAPPRRRTGQLSSAGSSAHRASAPGPPPHTATCTAGTRASQSQSERAMRLFLSGRGRAQQLQRPLAVPACLVPNTAARSSTTSPPPTSHLTGPPAGTEAAPCRVVSALVAFLLGPFLLAPLFPSSLLRPTR